MTAEAGPVGGPVRSGWRESTLTRARELAALADWVKAAGQQPGSGEPFGPDGELLLSSVHAHLAAVREAVTQAPLDPPRRWSRPRTGGQIERARSNLDAAEALLLDIAPAWYLVGAIPSLLGHAQRHLVAADPRRLEIERIASSLGIANPQVTVTPAEKLAIVRQERGTIAAVTRAASSAALREMVRVRTFRNVVVVSTAVMAVLVVAIAVIGFRKPEMIPICFAPEDGGQAMVVCPTAQSAPFPATALASPAPEVTIDEATLDTVRGWDLLLVLLIGLVAASVAAAAAVRGIRGSSERFGVPVALAVLKLPTGALTAFLGLLLLRGQFIPGLSALDSSAQILAWALVFGYAQQLFTRLVDQQGHAVLDSVRGASASQPTATPP
ncbi:hypothetical protein O7635_05845 [Asanoa sp. WMMD1127]|uniref:hypothetical protein n=1 Tax=Asanoa sp. WMMD1127 TaxID=3016107 RepID=UPI002417640A|nr:hypothetical protein [Asanoa sp. WMMD1127]MDG4821376.1 hypothetical protein [Asanoa sp. WMMD1127]